MVKRTAKLTNDIYLFVIFNCQQGGFALVNELSCMGMTQANFLAHIIIAIRMTNWTCEEGVNTLFSKVSGLSKLLHIITMNGWVTEHGSCTLEVGDHEVSLTHLMRKMAERGHGWTLAQLEVVSVFGPLLGSDQRLSIEIMGSVERSTKLVNDWRKEIDGPEIEVTGNLSEVFCHLESINLTNEPLHSSLLIFR